MVEVLRPQLERTGKRGGQNKLNVEDQHCWCWSIGGNIGLNSILPLVGGDSVAAVCRLIQKVEQLLLDSGKFRLPGKKHLYQVVMNSNGKVIN